MSTKIQDLPKLINRIVRTPDARVPFKKWLEDYVGDIGRGFLSSRSQFGSPWKPLKNPRPPGHNEGTRPLIDTGKLMQSVISKSSGNIERITANSLTFGTKLEYAAVHQYGSKDGRIPARPFLNVNNDQLQDASDMIAKYLVGVFSRAGNQ